MNAVIVVPFRPDGEIRSRNWEYAEHWWRQLELPICEGDGPRNEDFDITRARNAAVASATDAYPDWEVALMTDTDVVLGSPATALRAIDAAYALNQYVVAHDRMAYLGDVGTMRVVNDGDPPARRALFEIRSTWETVFAFTREMWEAIGGFDPRFRGFGHQVEAFFHAAKTLYVADRILGPCYHLWHPYSADQENPHLAANRELVERYWAASGDEDAMRELLIEYVVAA